MTEIKNENLEVKRPWQMKIWLSFYFIGIYIFLFSNTDFIEKFSDRFSFIFYFLFAFVVKVNYFIFFILENNKIDFLHSPFYFLFSALIIFNLFLIFSIIKGKKWAFIFLIISDLFFLYFIYQEAFDPIDGLLDLDFDLFLMVISFLFSVYLEISCLKHPFYNQKSK